MRVFLVFLLGSIIGLAMPSGAVHGQNDETKNRLDTLIPSLAQTYGRVQKSKKNKTLSWEDLSVFKTTLTSWDFKTAAYGDIPDGWRDLSFLRPSRNWMTDDQGYLRYDLKNYGKGGAYDPDTDSATGQYKEATRAGLIAAPISPETGNAGIEAIFKKAADNTVFFSVAGRIRDAENFYAVIISEDNRLAIAKIKEGVMTKLTEITFLYRYQYPEAWTLKAYFNDDLITGIVYDTKGRVAARIDARDGEWQTGAYGLYCTDYAAAKSFKVVVPASGSTVLKENTSETSAPSRVYGTYHLVKPAKNPDAVPASIEKVAGNYDVIIAGAGTGGWAAAVQAARMGRSVLLLEETDWIGGQMSAAAVTSMDESGAPVRERGIYREFHESIVNYYYGRDKNPFMAYFSGRLSQNQQQGGYEPIVARDILYGFIEDARNIAKQNPGHGKLDLLLRTTVMAVTKKGNVITGAKIRQWNENEQYRTKEINCKILVDATEYGDVIPLTGEPYRVGNTKSSIMDIKGSVQDHTYTAVIREYPDGIPGHLRIKVKPPFYDEFAKRYRNRVIYGDWGLHSGARMFRAELSWRGMADSESPLVGKMSQLRHTLLGLNGGNDYAVSVATIESPQQRLADEAAGVYRTLAYIYYLQHELGIPWSVAEDQGYNTAYNLAMMKKRGIPDALLPVASCLPQMPYVRESRRMEGLVTVVARDMQRREKAKHVATSIAVGDYFMDLHGTGEYVEKDLDPDGYDHASGPFQLPFEAFIPRKLDGFLMAEKNFSQSRLVSGATRLQPITMLTGQAVGTIAALATSKKIQPRELEPITVQLALLDQGVTLIPRWYTDVNWNTTLWKATQLLSLYRILDRPGTLRSSEGMGFVPAASWNGAAYLTQITADSALLKLGSLLGFRPGSRYKPLVKNAACTGGDLLTLASSIHPSFGKLLQPYYRNKSGQVTEEQFALVCLEIIKSQKQYNGGNVNHTN